jgi:TDG/mug DNA glycosylase family protein
MTDAPIVPDLLAPGLRLVFCGTAPSRSSAAARAYYANPGNRFWRTLHEVGLTPTQFAPADYPALLPLGIGLTDLCKHHSGNDDELPADGLDPAGLALKVAAYHPAVLAFTSMTAARIALGRPAPLGPQAETLGDTRLYVCCSTSGRARRFWRQDIWEGLAAVVRGNTPPDPNGAAGESPPRPRSPHASERA